MMLVANVGQNVHFIPPRRFVNHSSSFFALKVVRIPRDNLVLLMAFYNSLASYIVLLVHGSEHLRLLASHASLTHNS
ncbi:hypothetical protein VNO77_19241 [Canavalia gladiata]|uniref:Uncharacterized protein n=1 Tax=Canavalia gladiata TaxID=3824 RepID=A0AAN9LMZ9_CANGL